MELSSAQRVLIVGGAGFIGQHTITRLLENRHDLYATHVREEAPIVRPGVTWLPCDLGTADCTESWPRRCDTLMYLAQSGSWRSFPDGADDVFAVNVAAAFHALEYARRAGARRFVFVSTGSVYTQRNRPAAEDDPFWLNGLDNFYFASKLAAEILLKPFNTYLPIIVLRLFFPYGPGQHPDMLIPQLVRRVSEGTPIRLQGKDGLIVNPVAVADVVEVLHTCLSLHSSYTLNVGGPEVLSLREIGVCIGSVTGKVPCFEVHPDEIAPTLVGDTRALQMAFGWSPSTAFQSGLRDWLTRDAKRAHP